MCIDLLPEKLLQAIKRKKNDMNGTPLSQIFSYTISSCSNVPFYLYNFLFHEDQKNTLLKAMSSNTFSIKKLQSKHMELEFNILDNSDCSKQKYTILEETVPEPSYKE